MIFYGDALKVLREVAPPEVVALVPWLQATRVPWLGCTAFTGAMAVVMSAVLAFEMTKVWLSFTLKGANRVIREAKGR